MDMESTFNISVLELISNMSNSTYRELLKKASFHKKYGKFRSILIAFLALGVLIIGIAQFKVDLIIMSGLLFLLSWNNYTVYAFSVDVFKTIEELTKQFEGMNDIPE